MDAPRRGRPPKDRSVGDDSNGTILEAGTTIVIDPSGIDDSSGGNSGSVGDSGTGDGAPKRRGRKPGSTNKAKTAPFDLNAVEATLFSIHAMLATLTKTAELAIDKEEAKALSTAIGAVAAHYNVQASEKAIAWTNLAMVAGAIYAPRLIAMGVNAKAKPKAQRPQPVQTVVPINQGGNYGL